MRWHVISAVFWRNTKQYFTSIIGYLFIVVFVTVCALLAFDGKFFTNNLATLDQLNQYFPLLLLFLVPAITMNTWAEERRQGTDAILFTLPASDFEILLGKYLSVVAVYSIALLFSLTQLVALANIGQPDWGVVATVYLGYWLAGCALLSVGMFASSLTRSNTVAFIFAALFCALPVLAGSYFRGVVGVERLGVEWHLRDFFMGLVSVPDVLYFVSLTILMLYLNLVVISRRHWSKGRQWGLASQFAIRSVALAATLVGANYLVDKATWAMPTRIDLTHNRVFSLDETTRATLQKAAENGRPVTIQAYVSHEVPREFVHVKNHFLGLLRQFQRVGGSQVDLKVVEVRPYSDQAIEARAQGIRPKITRSDVGGNTVEQEVFLGAAISSTMGDADLPLVDAETSIEYELTRSIATATDKKKQLTVGVLATDLMFLGPLIDDARIVWSFDTALRELKKTYRFKPISAADLGRIVNPAPAPASTPDSPQPADSAASSVSAPDVLLVVGPSSLPQTALDDLVKYVQSGRAALILDDPLPFYWAFRSPDQLGVLNAPRQPRVDMRSPYRPALTEYAEEKAFGGTPIPLLNALGIEWNNGQIGWHDVEPLAGFKPFWPDYLGDTWPKYYGDRGMALTFVYPHGDYQPFTPDEPISEGLRRLLFSYPGVISQAKDSKVEFTPLVKLSPASGTIDWNDATFTPDDPRMPGSRMKMTSEISGSNLIVLDPDPILKTDDRTKAIAARITSKAVGDAKPINVVFIADTDFLSEIIPLQSRSLTAALDNVKFFQNALEVLAGDEDFVRLRNRQPIPRSLTRFEAVIERFRRDRLAQQQKIDDEIQAELEKAQTKLDTAVQRINEDKELDFAGKLQQLSQDVSVAQRQFDLQKQRLERKRDAEIDGIKANEQKNIARSESWVRLLSVGLAPLPAIALGIWVLTTRFVNERKQIKSTRRVS
jgi:ABC-2 type transport system permease protein